MTTRPTPAAGSCTSTAKAPTSAEQVRKHFVLDTNVLLHNPQSIFKFEEHEVVIPLTVLEELDTFKKNNDEKGRNARQVIRALDRLRSIGHLFEGVVWNEQGGSIRVMRFKAAGSYDLDLSIVDNRIIGVAHALHAAGLRAFPVIKDLVTDVSFNYKKAMEVESFTPPAGLKAGVVRLKYSRLQ